MMRRRGRYRPTPASSRAHSAEDNTQKAKPVKAAVFTPGPKRGRAAAYSQIAPTPERKPQVRKITPALAVRGVVRPTAFIVAFHSEARNTPFVTNSKILMTTPARSPPRSTRAQLILPIVPSIAALDYCTEPSFRHNPPALPGLAFVRAYPPSYACFRRLMSSFSICSTAFMTLFVFSASLSCISLPKTVGTICHDRPYLSLSQPHLPPLPPCESFSHSSSTSCCVSQFTKKEMASENLKCGPPFRAMNSCPSSWNVTVITVPFALPETFAASSP